MTVLYVNAWARRVAAPYIVALCGRFTNRGQDPSGDLLEKEVTQHSNGESSKSYYYYDDDGNLILRGNESTVFGSLQNATAFGAVSPTVSAFSYNGYGELTSATVNGVTTTYDYRPDGLRRSKTTLGVKTTHVWDGDDVIMDLDTALNVKAKYPRGLNLIECNMGTLSTEQYMHNYHGDVIGTINAVTGEKTPLLWRILRQ